MSKNCSTVFKDEEMKKTTHYHFTGWPDRGVPADVDNLLCFRDLVKNGRPESDGPIIVHCRYNKIGKPFKGLKGCCLVHNRCCLCMFVVCMFCDDCYGD